MLWKGYVGEVTPWQSVRICGPRKRGVGGGVPLILASCWAAALPNQISPVPYLVSFQMEEGSFSDCAKCINWISDLVCVLWEEYFFSLLAWPLSLKPWPDHNIALNFTQQTVRYAPWRLRSWMDGDTFFVVVSTRRHAHGAHTHTHTHARLFVSTSSSGWVPLCTFMGFLFTG